MRVGARSTHLTSNVGISPVGPLTIIPDLPALLGVTADIMLATASRGGAADRQNGHSAVYLIARNSLPFKLAEVASTAPKLALRSDRRSIFSWRDVQFFECRSAPVVSLTSCSESIANTTAKA